MDQDLINDFVLDSRELLDEVEPDLIHLWREYRESGNAKADFETLNRIFRLFHSLKGSAGFLSMENLVSLAHQAETILADVRSQRYDLNQSLVNSLCTTCDLVRRILDDIQSSGNDRKYEREVLLQISRLSYPASQESDDDGQALEEAAIHTPPSSATGGIVITPEMIRSFVSESDDQLKLIEACVLILAQVQDEDSLQEAFRCFHSIKGNAGFLGYKDIEILAHRVEDILEMLVERKQHPEETVCQFILKVVDQIRQAMVLIQAEKPARIADLNLLLGQLDALVKQTVQPAKKPKSKGKLKGTEAQRSEPMIEAEPLPLAVAPVVAEPSRSNPEQEQAFTLAEDLEKRSSSMRSSLVRKDIRVDLDKLDMLINLVGELVIAEAMVVHNPDLAGRELESFDKASRHLQKITRDLQDVALSIRMVPLAATFKKMVRLVHDLGVKTGKRLDLVIRGEDTEIDKTLVESISDPLVHLIRNCADHGIELGEERLKANKPETGTILLEARHDEGEVHIIVSDDGRGLDLDKIRNKALRLGLLQPDTEVTDQELTRLIFEPGFSTADKVTDISGRGVGLDVLKKNLEKLKGSVEVRSRKGQGVSFVMRIPLTLAIIEGMLVRCGSRHYTIPLLSIRESLKAKRTQVTTTMDGREIFSLRQQLIPIVRLHELHQIGDAHTDLERGILVIMESSSGSCGLLVDHVIGQQQTVIKPLSGFLGSLRGVSGCTIMGTGEISLILDVNSLLEITNLEESA